jgi:plasmid maintenance system killer protein
MSLESKINIVGSAKIKRNIYAAEYDSFETVKGKTKKYYIQPFHECV